MRKVLQMAHALGIQMALGFEFGIHPPELATIVPPDSRIGGAMLPDPTHPANIEILHAAARTSFAVIRAWITSGCGFTRHHVRRQAAASWTIWGAVPAGEQALRRHAGRWCGVYRGVVADSDPPKST